MTLRRRGSSAFSLILGGFYTGFEDLENSFGAKLGANAEFNLRSNLSLVVNTNYRRLNLDVEDDQLDLSGLEFNGGIKYRF